MEQRDMGAMEVPLKAIDDLSFSEKVNDLKFRIRYALYTAFLRLRAFYKAGFRSGPVILCYPEKPRFFHMITLIASYLGARITNNPEEPHDMALYFEDTTFRPFNAEIERIKKQERLVNAEATDISKPRVEDIFKKVFGYGSHIDPRTHHGVCVSKSINNAVHDGRIVQCPTEPEPNRIYQRFIENREGGFRFDIRVPYIGGRIPLVWKKLRPEHSPFRNLARAELKETTEVYSADEIKTIVAFGKEFGLDYGEFDIIRDPTDGKIYILDVNNTPATTHMVEHMPWRKYHRMVGEMAIAFKESFFTIQREA